MTKIYSLHSYLRLPLISSWVYIPRSFLPFTLFPNEHSNVHYCFPKENGIVTINTVLYIFFLVTYLGDILSTYRLCPVMW